MKLLVTGASGFLGRYVVAEALRQGHQVRAVLRPLSDESCLPWRMHPGVELTRLDLCQPDGISTALQNVDAVIHLAAVTTGDYQARFAGTVTATENLLQAMMQTHVLRLAAISTFSVYDYLHMPVDTTLDEDSPIEGNPMERDAYAQIKLIQEDRIRDFGQKGNTQVTILRPGMIYGRECLWNALLGAKLSENLWLRIGDRALMPLTYVENCAEAIVATVNCDKAIGQVINLVDDDLLTQRAYANQLIQRMDSPPKRIPINWTLMRLLGRMAWLMNKFLLKGQVRLPGLLAPARLHARFKPLRYSNRRAKEILGWTPRYSLNTALDRSCSEIELLAVSPSKQIFSL